MNCFQNTNFRDDSQVLVWCCFNIFWAIRSEESCSINGVNARGIYYGDAHEVALSVKYNFGSLNEPNYKNRDIDENLDRIR